MAGIRQYDDGAGSEYGSKFPITSVTARIVTLVSLIVTIAVIKINHLTYDNGYVRTYKDFRSYRFVLNNCFIIYKCRFGKFVFVVSNKP